MRTTISKQHKAQGKKRKAKKASEGEGGSTSRPSKPSAGVQPGSQTKAASSETPPGDTTTGRIGAVDDGDDERRKQSVLLIELAEDAELFHNSDREAFACVPVDDHRENYRLNSKNFRLWLTRRFYRAYHKTPSAQALQDATAALAAKAIFDGPELTPAVRLAKHQGAVYLDLADDQWRAVKITPTGWQMVSNPPVKFLRRRGMKPLPVPERGGSVDELRKFINVADDPTWTLIKGWMLGILLPENKYAILAVNGEQGSAKTTACEMIRATMDPNECPLRSLSTERDLMIAAANGWIIAFDNLSGIPGHVSDSLCRLATGGGFATRELYTDEDEKLFSGARPILFNGIEELGTRPDLIDRMIVVQLQAIAPERRRPVQELWDGFEKARPRILGALLDAVSAAMRNLPKVKLAMLPRMADFAKWVTAGEAALGIAPGAFMVAYTRNRNAANDLAIEASPIGPPLISLMESHDLWTGTAKELLSELCNNQSDEMARRRPDWPGSPKAFSDKLRRLVPVLRVAGILVTFPGRSKYGTSITLERMAERPTQHTPPTPAKPTPGVGGVGGDAHHPSCSHVGEGVIEL